MSSVRLQGWDALVLRIQSEPLSQVASAAEVEEFELIARLVVAGARRPAESTEWWPEAVRMRRSGVSLREIARRFQTEPRRIRRGLARLSMRVAGQDLVDGEGAPKLSLVRDRLGTEPDRVIAKAAGVTPEAVKGERHRLEVAPYFQRRRVKLTADDEAWIRGPKKAPRTRFRPDPEPLAVVRRPLSRPADEPRRVPEVEVRRVEPEPRAPGLAPVRYHENVNRNFFRSDNRAELDRLTEPTTRREGPRRLVRTDAAPVAVPPMADDPRRPPSSVRGPTLSPPATPAREPRSLPSVPTVRPRLGQTTQASSSAASTPSAPAAAQVAVAPSGETEIEPADIAWNVGVPGWEHPLVVWAPDIASAVLRAADKVPAKLLARASVWRADGPNPCPDWL